MALTPDEKLALRAAIGVARNGAPRDLDDALRILNEQILDDTYPYSLIGATSLAEAERRSDAVFLGAYTEAWAALRRELAIAPPIGGDVFSPEPEPHEDSYPTPPAPIPSYEPPTYDEFSEGVLQVLRNNGVFLKGGRVGLGMEPIQDTDARLSIEGGQILGANNGNWQNPVRHENVLDLCNSDGGIRFLQYIRWFGGKIIRSTTNRLGSIFAIFDSQGNTCINDTSSAHGQYFYLHKNHETKTITLAAYQPGWTVEIRETSADAPYGAMDVRKL